MQIKYNFPDWDWEDFAADIPRWRNDSVCSDYRIIDGVLRKPRQGARARNKYVDYVVSFIRHYHTNYDQVMLSIPTHKRQALRAELKEQVNAAIVERYPWLQKVSFDKNNRIMVS